MRRFYVYILANRRYGVLYIGMTNNLVRRVSQHRQKTVPGFTSEHGVIRLVYFEEYLSVTEARARERSVKRWRRAWKLALIDQANPEWRDLADDCVRNGPGSAAHHFATLVLRCARDTVLLTSSHKSPAPPSS